MIDVTHSEPEAEARERLAKAVESFDGTDEEARDLSNRVLLAMEWKGYRRQDNHHEMEWYGPNGEYEMEMHPLRSVDDAMKMLSEGWWLCYLSNTRNVAPVVYATNGTQRAAGTGATIQAAITATALRCPT